MPVWRAVPNPVLAAKAKLDVRLLWTADRTGTIYAGVENLALSDSPNATGPYARYRLTGVEYANRLYLPLIQTDAIPGAPIAATVQTR